MIMENKNKKKKPSKNPEEAFAEIVSKPQPKQLLFDSETQELLMADPEDKKKTGVVVDQIYKDGFFCY